MKRNLTIVLSILFILVLLQFSSLRLVSNSAQPPSPGYAGDPGQTTCNNCHIGSTRTDGSRFTIKLSPDSAGLIGNANVVTASTQYIPDSTQWMAVELNGTNGNNTVYGFQLTALDSIDNLAGTFTLTNTAKTSTQFSNFTQRRYVGHKNAEGTTKKWSFKWKAPHQGRVTFYYTANFANGDGTENVAGDSVYQSNSTINAGPINVGIADLTPNINSANVYPVPFSQDFHTDISLDRSSVLTITLMSLNGSVVRSLYDDYASQGRFSRSFDLSTVASGLYFVRVQSGSSVHTVKVTKL